jgi:hypothetical protein
MSLWIYAGTSLFRRSVLNETFASHSVFLIEEPRDQNHGPEDYNTEYIIARALQMRVFRVKPMGDTHQFADLLAWMEIYPSLAPGVRFKATVLHVRDCHRSPQMIYCSFDCLSQHRH